MEKTVSREDRDMVRHVRKSVFFRPSDESASVARTSPPTRQPMKKEDAGRPVTIEAAHSNDHSEMIEVCAGQSQAHEFLGRRQMFETESHEDDDSSPS